MRARSKEQRFPVQQWAEDLDILQLKSIKINNKVRNGSGSPFSTPAATRNPSASSTPAGSPPGSPPGSLPGSRPSSPPPASHPPMRRRLSSLFYPVHPTEEQYRPFRRRLSSLFPTARRSPFQQSADRNISEADEMADIIGPLSPRPSTSGSAMASFNKTSNPGSPKNLFNPSFAFSEEPSLPGELTRPTLAHYRRSSTLSVDEVVSGRTDYKLQAVDQSFTDSNMSELIVSLCAHLY